MGNVCVCVRESVSVSVCVGKRLARINRKAAGEVLGLKHADGLRVRNAPYAETLDHLHHRPPFDLL